MVAINIVHELPNPYDRLKLEIEIVGSCFALYPAKRSSLGASMRFVPVKSADQQAAAMVLKTRELLVRQRIQAINALRAHLSELGIIAAAGSASPNR
jgi:hypothetical protein